MKVLYDHQIFDDQYYGGASSYFVNLLGSIRKLALADFELGVDRTGNVPLATDGSWLGKKKAAMAPSMFLPWLKVKGKGELRRRLVRIGLLDDYTAQNRALSLSLVSRGGYDVFHPTHYQKYWDAKDARGKIVTTIYDMTYERHPEFFRNDDPYPALKLQSAKDAARIIAISENTKKDMVDIWNIDPGKIDVIPLGPNFEAIPMIHPSAPASKPYILYVGTRKGYKNFERFLESAKPILEENAGLRLICAGGGSFSGQESASIKRMGLSSRVRQKAFINSDELFRLYSQAAFFVFPSIYEGFGLPILESFSAGCPVVLSRASCFPEIAGDAGRYFDPFDPGSMTAAMNAVLNLGAEERTGMISRGRSRLGLFSWDNCAIGTVRTYEKVVAR